MGTATGTFGPLPSNGQWQPSGRRLGPSQQEAGLRTRSSVGGMEKATLHAADSTLLAWHARPVRTFRLWPSRPSWSSSVSNVMKNLSNFVSELVLLLLYRADDDGGRRSCLRNERRSGASRLEGSVSAAVHEHERSLAGRDVGCRTLSQAAQLE